MESSKSPTTTQVSLPWAKLRLSPCFAEFAPTYEVQAWRHITAPNGGIAVDVGAHQGFYTLKLAREVGPNGWVYAVEPNRENFRILCDNVNANGFMNVVPMCLAVSDADGEGTLVTYRTDVDRDSGKHFLRGTSRWQPYWDKPNMPIPSPEKEVVVQTRTLDRLVSHPDWLYRLDLVKIDVEGAESKVLQGAQDTLKRYSPKVVIELHYHQLAEILRHPSPLLEAGYRLTDYVPVMNVSPNPFAIFEKVKP